MSIAEREPDPGAAAWRIPWLEAGLLLAIAVATRLGSLGHAPTFDELYHLLAARSWAAEGTLRIADGSYGRAAPLTIFIGWLFRIFGESLAVARLPSLLAGSLLVPVVFLWTHRFAGRAAAWIAALLLCVAPLALFVSGYIRFYAVHGLLWFLAAACFYGLAAPERTVRDRLLLAGLGAILLWAGYYLQRTVLIGIAGIVTWIALDPVGRPMSSSRRRAIGLAALALGVAVVLAVSTGLAGRLLDGYRWAAEWSADRDLRFYHWVLVEKYPTLWPLLPFAALLAIARRRGPALFSACLLGVGLALHSFAGMKAERYLYYLLPYFFVLWGIAIAEVLPALAGGIRQGVARALRLATDHPLARRAGVVAGTTAVGFLVIANAAFPMAGRMILGQPAYVEVGPDAFRESAEADWQAAAPALEPWLERADVVVTTNGLQMLYHFGDYDIELSPTRLSDIGGGQFRLDRRTGRLLIASPDALRRVIECHRVGLFVSPPAPLARGGRRLREVLEEQTRRLSLPREVGLDAFVWQRAAADPAPPGCAELAAAGRTSGD